MDFFNDLNPYLVRQGNNIDAEDSNSDDLNYIDTLNTTPIRQADPLGDFDQSILDTVNQEECEEDIQPEKEQPEISTNNEEEPISTVIDQTYIANILRLNIGKIGTFYFTYNNSQSWLDKVYKGIIEQAGRDHFTIYDPKNKKRYLLLYSYFLWVEFDEQIAYNFINNN